MTSTPAKTATAQESPDVLVVAIREAVAKADEAAGPYLRQAADAAAKLRDLKWPQRKIAESVGKSQSWVCQLLRWRKDGFLADTSPFDRPRLAANQAKAKSEGKTKSGRATTRGKHQPAQAAYVEAIRRHLPKMALDALMQVRTAVEAEIAKREASPGLASQAAGTITVGRNGDALPLHKLEDAGKRRIAAAISNEPEAA